MSESVLSLAAKLASGYSDPSHSLLICLCTGASLPNLCAPMPRLPAAPLGAAIDDDFASVLLDALSINLEIHDGSVMALRPSPNQAYRVAGWSYRLFPHGFEAIVPEPNRGSAFHSGLAMSAEPGVDAVIFAGGGDRFVFVEGEVRWREAW